MKAIDSLIRVTCDTTKVFVVCLLASQPLCIVIYNHVGMVLGNA